MMQSAISNDQQVEPTSGFLVETNMPTSGFKRNIAEVYRLAGQALPAHHISKDDSDCDLVPVFVGIIKDGMELREELLWRNGTDGLSHAQAASMFCSELGLSQHYERLVSEQLNTQSLPRVELGRECVFRFNVYVRQGSQVFRDTIDWDLSSSYNLPHQYASQVCEYLRLSNSWFMAIDKEVSKMVKHTREELSHGGGHVYGALLDPLQQTLVKERDGARLEEYQTICDPTSEREGMKRSIQARIKTDQSAKPTEGNHNEIQPGVDKEPGDL